jgi:hypothetical protein
LRQEGTDGSEKEGSAGSALTDTTPCHICDDEAGPDIHEDLDSHGGPEMIETEDGKDCG